ncbi:GNAT family N-acetyltransferase [Winogradskya consettensis]|uniref:N-acetyltransferase n=1 Tax=Winogradskya consettensis TaxID=113560 RepID=A0A919W1E8_9ACTN|nr:GNAT family N-acetyltransferase [Actinoplanes consettensis]GIM83427.1 N-acetyltransferase [Actinoplanes consettensis]
MLIREPTLADVDRIADVHTRARASYYQTGGLLADSTADPAGADHRREAWTQAVESPDHTIYCAVIDDKVVGAVAMGPALTPTPDGTPAGQLFQIHVDPPHWSKGIGTRLHATFLTYLRRTNTPTGLLEVWQQNTRALLFYAHHGWSPTGTHRPGPHQTTYQSMHLKLPTPA